MVDQLKHLQPKTEKSSQQILQMTILKFKILDPCMEQDFIQVKHSKRNLKVHIA